MINIEYKNIFQKVSFSRIVKCERVYVIDLNNEYIDDFENFLSKNKKMFNRKCKSLVIKNGKINVFNGKSISTFLKNHIDKVIFENLSIDTCVEIDSVYLSNLYLYNVTIQNYNQNYLSLLDIHNSVIHNHSFMNVSLLNIENTKMKIDNMYIEMSFSIFGDSFVGDIENCKFSQDSRLYLRSSNIKIENIKNSIIYEIFIDKYIDNFYIDLSIFEDKNIIFYIGKDFSNVKLNDSEKLVLKKLLEKGVTDMKKILMMLDIK